MIDTIVSTEWLNNNLDNPNLIVLEAVLSSSVNNKDIVVSDLTIPKSRVFNLKKCFSDTTSEFPNTIPSKEQFEREARKLGISNDSIVVIYDTDGIYLSPRVWWLFKVMGKSNVAVLNGGFSDWKNNGFPIAKRRYGNFNIGNFKAVYNKDLVVSFEEVSDNVSSKVFIIVDTRSKGRYDGTEDEPRQHLQSGHIPNSINIPYQDVLDNGKFKTKEELKSVFEHKGNPSDKLVFTCGSGITACIVMLANEIAFSKSKRVYDGSWTEWATLKNLTKDNNG